MPRGGKRTPEKPAAVSGPGAMSRRTDGGAGQKVRPTPAASYGDRVASIAQQKAAPMRAGGATAPPPQMGGPAAGGGVPGPEMDVFRPTERPNEPLTAGVPAGPGAMGRPQISGALDQLRALYSQYPDDDLLDAIIELEERGA